MVDTVNLKLPLLDPAQAQKHVTVNEALTRIDAAYQKRVISRGLSTPPASPVEGDTYLVAAGGSGDWTGQDGEVAVYVNGGWRYLTPLPGWRLWSDDEAVELFFDGANWIADVLSFSPASAAMRAEIIEFDHVLVGGSASEDTTVSIPSHSSVFAVTGRVIGDITGSLTDWSLGVDGSETRYGSGLGLTQGAFVQGLTGQPVAYFAPTALRLTANGGTFSSGTVRLSVHTLQFDIPNT